MDSELPSLDVVASEPAGSSGSPVEATPIFRVKRYRKKDYAAVDAPLAPPRAKAVSALDRQPLNRGDGLHMASDYLPPSLGPLSVGGLPPPVSRVRWPDPIHAPCGGLQCESFPVLKVHSGSWSLQMSTSPMVQRAPPPSRPTLSNLPLVASEPLRISRDVVAASGSASSTMLEVHQQLKNQHIQAWIQLLIDAGSLNE